MKEYETRVVDLLKSGRTPREIKTLLPRVSSCFISGVRKKIGMPKFKVGRSTGFENKTLPDLIRKLKALGLTYGQIGKAFGFSRQRAQQHFLKRWGEIPNQLKQCVVCGKTGKRFHRHHSDYTNDNTVLMCRSCHLKFHWNNNQ